MSSGLRDAIGSRPLVTRENCGGVRGQGAHQRQFARGDRGDRRRRQTRPRRERLEGDQRAHKDASRNHQRDRDPACLREPGHGQPMKSRRAERRSRSAYVGSRERFMDHRATPEALGCDRRGRSRIGVLSRLRRARADRHQFLWRTEPIAGELEDIAPRIRLRPIVAVVGPCGRFQSVCRGFLFIQDSLIRLGR